jgi:hypothetical protein
MSGSQISQRNIRPTCFYEKPTLATERAYILSDTSMTFEVFCDMKLLRWVTESDTWQEPVPSASRVKQLKPDKREGKAILRNVGNHEKCHSPEELNPQ